MRYLHLVLRLSNRHRLSGNHRTDSHFKGTWLRLVSQCGMANRTNDQGPVAHKAHASRAIAADSARSGLNLQVGHYRSPPTSPSRLGCYLQRRPGLPMGRAQQRALAGLWPSRWWVDPGRVLAYLHLLPGHRVWCRSRGLSYPYNAARSFQRA